MRETAFDHVFTPITVIKVRLPNGEYTTVIEEGDPILGKLVIVTAREAEQAAARGVKADWIGKLPLGTPVSEGQEFRVTGLTMDLAWTESIRVTGDLKGDRINRRFAAVDAAL